MSARKGEQNPAAKLTDEEVCAIRRDARPFKQIAYDYNISVVQAWRIRKRIKWKHLPEEKTDDA